MTAAAMPPQADAPEPGLLRLAWPIFAEQSLHMLTNVVSTLMASHIGDDAVAALGSATGKFREVNPIANAPADAKPAQAERTLPKFVAAGNIVLACHRAFGSVVELVKRVDKLATDDEAETKAKTFLLPGVILQPSGVFATLRAQEAGCHYILAS